MQIEAALLNHTDAPFEVVPLDIDEPGPNEVLVRLAASGVCASDAHTRSGHTPSPLPCVLGHEGAGVVVATGANVGHVVPGDHVALSWMPSCGHCRHCVVGRPVLCSAAAPALLAGTMLDGTVRLHDGGRDVNHYSFLSTFATHTVVPAASAVKIPDDVPLALAALVGCAVLTGYGAAVNRAKVEPGQSVLVFGAGGVGLSAIMGAKLSGAAQIIVVDPVAEKCAVAIDFGATAALQPGDDLVDRVRELTDGDGVDVAIDAVGAPGILDTAFGATVLGGTIVCVGVPGPDARPSLPGPDLVRTERVVTGCLYGSSRPGVDIPRILDLYRRGLLPIDRLVSKTYSLSQINDAFDDMAAGRLSRGVIVYDEAIAW
ncbi:MAG: Zn-dependent alcohol dehydrogenase [Williamsia herbipolensis]|nr:Zn-dependent alcohol dehydrogenase [Williamsia herbipolensis]